MIVQEGPDRAPCNGMPARERPALMTGTLTPPAATVTVSGEIDICTCEAMRDALAAGLGPGPVHLTVDLSAVTFIDASGIGVLLAIRALAAEAGGSLTLRAPSRAVRRLVEILGLGEVLPVAEA